MNNNIECAEYFRSKSEYRRCMEAFRKKWKSLGRASGCIKLADTSESERRAIGGILGRTFQSENISVDFAKFEQGLQRTRFAPVDMKEVLEAYFGETLCTNQGEKQALAERKNEFFQGIRSDIVKQSGEKTVAASWLDEMANTKKYGYRQLVKEYNRDSHKATALAAHVATALLQLEAADVDDAGLPLAVFAAGISGNPHYFDRGTTAGQLLLQAVCYWKKSELPANAHQWRKLLLDAGIVPDNVSSMVHAYGLHLRTDNGWHPAYESFCTLREPYVVTMENLKGITGAGAENGRVYIVENEMVFCYLLEQIRESCRENKGGLCGQHKGLTILCTSGQLRTAAQKLIPLILDSGADIYYSGDIDPDGIGIADRLRQKYDSRIHIWRMAPEDYEKGISGELIGSNGLSKLENIRSPLLRQTADRVREKQRAAYQENLLEELLGDIM